jgi:hypothetical protein
MDWNSLVSMHKNDPAFESFLLKYKDDPDFEWFKTNYSFFGASESIEISYTIENDVICNYKDSRLSIDNNDLEKNRSYDECLLDIPGIPGIPAGILLKPVAIFQSESNNSIAKSASMCANPEDSILSIDNNDTENNRSSIHDECSDIVNDVNNRIVYTPDKNNLIFKESSKYSSEFKYLRDCTCNNCTGENNSLTENIPCMNIKLEYINFSPSSLSEINYQNLPCPVFKLIRFFIYIIFITWFNLYN